MHQEPQINEHYIREAHAFIISNLDLIYTNIKAENQKPLNQVNWQNLFKVGKYKSYLQLLSALSERNEDYTLVHCHLIEAFIANCMTHPYFPNAEKIYSDKTNMIYKLILNLPSCYQSVAASKTVQNSESMLSQCFYEYNVSSSSHQLSDHVLNNKVKSLQSFIENQLMYHSTEYIWAVYQKCFRNLQDDEDIPLDEDGKADEVNVAPLWKLELSIYFSIS